MLEFTYGNLTQCFTSVDNHSSLDHLLFLICQRIQLKKSSSDVVNDTTETQNFSTILPCAQLIRLPKEAHIQIDSALNEMEAMDYRDWVRNNVERNYFIVKIIIRLKTYYFFFIAE